MHAKSLCVFSLSCLLTAALAAGAQDRKPGLYDMTMVTTTILPSANSYPPRTMQYCLTQDMIDKYGAMVPDTPTRACQLANVVKKPGGMTADMICSGPINGKGRLEVNWSDSEHAKGNLHFSGTIRPGQDEIKIEWNAASTNVYKGPDCGTVKTTLPAALPPPAPPAPAPE